MQVLDADGATRLYAQMRQARETSGGSAANTMAGVAALGGRAGFVGQVADDQLGEIFTHDIRALGVEFLTPPRSGGAPTGRCLILVTPDAQRTMNTFRGAAHELDADALDAEQIRGAAILYLEAYLWRSAGPRAAMEQAMAIAHEAGRKVAFTLSDIACIAPHRAEMMAMIEAARSTCSSPTRTRSASWPTIADRDAAIAAIQDKVPLHRRHLRRGRRAGGRARPARRGADRADRHGRGRHDRRRRSVRRRLPGRPGAGARASRTACASARSRRPR